MARSTFSEGRSAIRHRCLERMAMRNFVHLRSVYHEIDVYIAVYGGGGRLTQIKAFCHPPPHVSRVCVNSAL